MDFDCGEAGASEGGLGWGVYVAGSSLISSARGIPKLIDSYLLRAFWRGFTVVIDL
jgi:hypothetical protein